jgi:hypothetical protein
MPQTYRSGEEMSTPKKDDRLEACPTTFLLFWNRKGSIIELRPKDTGWVKSYFRGGIDFRMIKAFNKHYREALDLLENSSSSDKLEIAEKIMDWFHDLPEEYLVSLALFFNEVIDDLGDDSIEKIDLEMKGKKGDAEEEEEEDFEEEEEEEDDEDEEDY